MRPSVFRGIRLVFCKEAVTGLRFKASWLTMLMFALTALSCVSLSLRGAAAEAELQAALLWVVLFFSAMTGVDRLFADESMAGTLLTLQVCGEAQAVLFGKMLYAFFLLLAMAFFAVPLFLILLDAPVHSLPVLLLAVLLGVAGLAAAGTFLAALAAGAHVKSGLFPVLMLPVLLPVLLPAIAVTAEAFSGKPPSLPYLGGMAIYDVLLALGASVLFDYFWYED